MEGGLLYVLLTVIAAFERKCKVYKFYRVRDHIIVSGNTALLGMTEAEQLLYSLQGLRAQLCSAGAEASLNIVAMFALLNS